MELTKRNLLDVVLWNIGGEKATAMADLGPGEWQRSLCLEAGAVGSAVRVPPGAMPLTQAWLNTLRPFAMRKPSSPSKAASESSLQYEMNTWQSGV